MRWGPPETTPLLLEADSPHSEWPALPWTLRVALYGSHGPQTCDLVVQSVAGGILRPVCLWGVGASRLLVLASPGGAQIPKSQPPPESYTEPHFPAEWGIRGSPVLG